jgi:hypothetical protein
MILLTIGNEQVHQLPYMYLLSITGLSIKNRDLLAKLPTP